MELSSAQREELWRVFLETQQRFPLENTQRLKENVQRMMQTSYAPSVVPSNPFQRPTLHYYHGLEDSPFLDSRRLQTSGLIDNHKIKAEFQNFLSESKLVENLETFRDGAGRIPSYLSGNLKVVDVVNPSDLPGVPAPSPKSEYFFAETRKALFSCEGFANSAFFSLMYPGSHIQAHYSEANVRYTLHLGIQIPSDCFLQVAEEKLTWVENKAIIFDGSFKHEAWNFGDQLRVILIAYLWHPSLNKAERFFIDSIDERVLK